MNHWNEIRQELEQKHFDNDGLDVSLHKRTILWSWAQNAAMDAAHTGYGSNNDDIDRVLRVTYAELAGLCKPD